MTGEEATFTVAGSVVVPGVTATVLTMVVPAGTLSTVGAEDGGIFWVAAAAAAKAAMPLICGLLPMTCNGTGCVSPRSAGAEAARPLPLGFSAPLRRRPLSFPDCLGLLCRPQTWTPTTAGRPGPLPGSDPPVPRAPGSRPSWLDAPLGLQDKKAHV